MKTLTTLLGTVGLVAAHGYVDSATIGGKDYQVGPLASFVVMWSILMEPTLQFYQVRSLPTGQSRLRKPLTLI